jgi:hypothetical protein
METQLVDRACQLRRRRVGRVQRQLRKAAVTGGVTGARIRQRVIIGPRDVDTFLTRHQIGARTGDRQHLHGDSAGIHVGEPRIAEVGQFPPLDGLRPGKVGAGKASGSDGVR